MRKSLLIILLCALVIFTVLPKASMDEGFDVSQCDVWVLVSDSTSQITQSGCYVVSAVEPPYSITISEGAYSGPVIVDLNGQQVGLDHSEGLPADTYFFNGTLRIYGRDYGSMGGHTFMVEDANVQFIRGIVSSLSRAYFWGPGSIVFRNVAVEGALHFATCPNVELNSVTATDVALNCEGEVILEDTAVVQRLVVSQEGAHSLILKDLNLPTHTVISKSAGIIDINNVYVGNQLVELNPDSVSEGGAYFVSSPDLWDYDTPVSYVGILWADGATIQGVRADYLAYGGNAQELRNVFAGNVYAAQWLTGIIPDIYDSNIGLDRIGEIQKDVWAVVNSELDGEYEHFAIWLDVNEWNVTGSYIQIPQLSFIEDTNVYGGRIGLTDRFEEVRSQDSVDIRFEGTELHYAGPDYLFIYLRKGGEITFDRVKFTSELPAFPMQIKGYAGDVTVIFDSVDVQTDSIPITCLSGSDVTVVLRGTTPVDKFTFSSACTLIDETQPSGEMGDDADNGGNGDGSNIFGDGEDNNMESSNGGGSSSSSSVRESSRRSSVQPASPVTMQVAVPSTTQDFTTYVAIGVAVVFIAMFLRKK